jgi:hypothetical protein
MEKIRLSDSNINEYLKKYYGPIDPISKNIISDIEPLLQKDYGDINDCTITSITTLLYFLTFRNIDITTIYNKVANIAWKFFYRPKWGTSSIMILPIISCSLKYFGLKWASIFLPFKNICFNFRTIKKNIDKGKPIVLSTTSDGRNYYKNHSILVIGYMEYSNKVRMLAVYDNWNKGISYVDYSKLSLITSINYQL